jgi:hypothetical protein
MELIDGFQISDASPADDGSLSTNLIDDAGNVVGTVTRLSDGTATASVQNFATDSGGFDWSGVLGKVTSFLDNVANAAQTTGQEATRVSRAIKGGVTGAQVGYNAPLNWKPWAIGGAAVLAVALIAASSQPSRRR